MIHLITAGKGRNGRITTCTPLGMMIHAKPLVQAIFVFEPVPARRPQPQRYLGPLPAFYTDVSGSRRPARRAEEPPRQKQDGFRRIVVGKVSLVVAHLARRPKAYSV